MAYDLVTTKQIYGNQSFLTHNIKGETDADDRHLFGMRVESYGIINFGQFADEQRKSITPSQHGINTDIMLRSIFAFTNSPTAEEIYLRLFLGRAEFLEQKITNNEMPYTFPPGAILNKDLRLEIQAKQVTNQVILYWQPIHVLDYLEIS